MIAEMHGAIRKIAPLRSKSMQTINRRIGSFGLNGEAKKHNPIFWKAF